MASDYKDKSVIITGAATGVGKALALELGRRGAVVYVTALTRAEAQPVADIITANGGRAEAAKVDVTEAVDLQEIITRVTAEQGQLDIMVNNAGIVFIGEFFDMDEAFIEKLIAVNLTAVTLGSLYAYRQMKTQGQGQILNISSVGGFVPVGTMAVYAATKHGVLGLTNSLAGEAKDHGIDVQAACLGNVQSELINRAEAVQPGAIEFGKTLPKGYPADKAAIGIADKLARKKHPIFVPGYAGAIWRLARFFPAVTDKSVVDGIRKYRALRKKGSPARAPVNPKGI